ncbi:hypothetical protein SO802_015777 [Lithocarpus litseifolius]|uniref:Uncharacterized protein n=1 Tax=Lithocarpus litseifolius TaxID=425828 RepID=A0AAW2CYA0_9ROSI
MVDMVEAMVMGDLIVEITIGSDTEMMTAMGMRPQRESQIMNPGEVLIMTRDRKRIPDSERVVTLMMTRKMIGSDDPSNIRVTVF